MYTLPSVCLSVFLPLFVRLLATSHKNYRFDLREIFTRDDDVYLWTRIALITVRKLSLSRNYLKDSSTCLTSLEKMIGSS